MTLRNAFANLAIETKQDEMLAALANLLTNTRQAVRGDQTAGVQASLLSATGSTRADTASGVALGTVLSGLRSDTASGVALGTVLSDLKPGANSAFEMVQITYNLTRRVGADASADVSGTWTSRSNAQGINDAASATSAGAVTGASRKMSLDYADHTGKTDLAISSVKILIYASMTDALVGSTATFAYSIGGAEVDLIAPQTANFNWLTTPQEITLTGTITTWAQLDALQTFVTHAYGAASSLNTVSVDAIELEVIASATQTL